MLRTPVAERGAGPQSPNASIGIAAPERRQISLPLHPARRHVPSRIYACWHLSMDIAFGLCGLFLLLLLLPVVALLIRLDSPGPIFYRQERLGYRRKPLFVLKFRSMRCDAEAAGNAIWAAKDDPRVTRVGRFLRATHLDELPQVINILRGQMSLIGPRPERDQFARTLEEANPLFRHRLLVKPGLTGWAQVNSGYAGSSDESQIKLAYDLFYIEHRSLPLDLKIILKTGADVIGCRGQ